MGLGAALFVVGEPGGLALSTEKTLGGPALAIPLYGPVYGTVKIASCPNLCNGGSVVFGPMMAGTALWQLGGIALVGAGALAANKPSAPPRIVLLPSSDGARIAGTF